MADLIKKIKIKKQDGTFTDYIPIGAEAKNVVVNDGESVENKINKKPYYYSTVAEMKADTKLKNGDMAITLGYYKPNDGGGAEYMITNITSSTEYQEDMGNLYATLIMKDVIYPEQFGAYGDGRDETAIFETMTGLKSIIANHLTIRGISGHRYKVVDLQITKINIENCDFVGDYDSDGIRLKSFAHLRNCNFHNYRKALYCKDVCVHSSIEKCFFQYNRYGCFLYEDNNITASINNLLINNCYFVKNGINVDDMSGAETQDVGYGIVLDNNYCQVVITNNVFEYNSFTGIFLKQSTNNYNTGCQILHNYFEGNRNSAIYIDYVGSTRAMLGIKNNYFSSEIVNIRTTKYIKINTPVRTYYEIEDIYPFTFYIKAAGTSSNVIENEDHTYTINNNNDSNQYFWFVPAKNTKAINVKINAILNNDLKLQLGSGDTKQIVTLTNGINIFTIDTNNPNYGSWYIQRQLSTDENVTVISLY